MIEIDKVVLNAIIEKIKQTQPTNTGKWLIYQFYLPSSQFKYLQGHIPQFKLLLRQQYNKPCFIETIGRHEVKIGFLI